jgi:hypothetical protein
MVTTSGTMNLKIALNPNPILSVAAAVVAYASGADAQDYNADYDNETCKNTPPQAWGAKFATIEGCCTSALFWVEDCVANSNGVTPTPAPSDSVEQLCWNVILVSTVCRCILLMDIVSSQLHAMHLIHISNST